LPRTLKIGWHSADLMWRLAGDTATDYNHYTKRALLMGIYTRHAGGVRRGRERRQGRDRAFLDRRIEDVMQFEKAKAQLLQKREGFDVARFLGRPALSGPLIFNANHLQLADASGTASR
jgi:ubiquinone biosynthesis protein COQ9